MRSALPWIALLALVRDVSEVHAASGDCGLMRDEDKRRLCFAVGDNRSSEYGLIRDGDERRMCRVWAERQR